MEIDWLAVASRWIHVGTAIVLVGGLVFLRFVLGPAAAQLPEEAHSKLKELVLAKWKKFIHGGIALFLGLFTRLAAFLVAGEMFVATLQVHLPNGFFMNWTNAMNVGHGIEYTLALIGAALALSITGGGRLSVDAALKR